jgi:glycosyltransferase involved in cell wall biosynthesis
MLHVMHVIDSLQIGGAERMLVDLANVTVELGHRASVCVTRSAGPLATELRAEVGCHVLGRRSRFDLAGLHRAGRLVRTSGADVLHVHGRSSFSLMAALRAVTPGFPPIVLHDHFGRIEIDPHLPSWFRRWGRRALSAYVGVHPQLGAIAAAAGVPADRIHTIGNALDLGRLLRAEPLDVRRELGLPATVVGIMAANLRPEKGLHVLVEALGCCAPERRPTVVVAGREADPKYVRRCRDRIAALGLSDRIVVTGERPDLPRLILGVDFAVMPSVSESGPLVLIEYLVAGLPIVATRTGEIGRGLAEGGLLGFVPPDDPRALAAELERIATAAGPELRARGGAGRHLARERFEIRGVMGRWLDIYRQVAEGRTS